jgi:hypothetical protein
MRGESKGDDGRQGPEGLPGGRPHRIESCIVGDGPRPLDLGPRSKLMVAKTTCVTAFPQGA